MKYVRLTNKERLKLVDYYNEVDFCSPFEEVQHFAEKFGLKYTDFQGTDILTLDCYYEIVNEKKFTFACIKRGICPELIESLD